MKSFFLGAALAASALSGTPAVGQQRSAAPAPAPAVTSSVSDRPVEIPLDRSSGADTEQWENIWGMRGVRNVSRPTITPFLPPANIATGAAVVIAPGGAFVYLSMDNEGYDVARWFASKGIAAFVLKYRIGSTPRDTTAFTNLAMTMAKQMTDPAVPKVDPKTPPKALEDGRAALRLVRARASEFGVDPKRVGFVGFSAGAVLAMSVGLAENVADRPDFIGNIYGSPEARVVPTDAPPLFLGLALDDPIVARGQLGLMNAWRAAKRPIEAHFYGSGGHGFGMTSKGAATGLWIQEFNAWLKDRRLLTPAAR